ncbi:hypothetical protein E4U46_005903 [Claviceps purpurea]|nr:hypothetical protein E4U36_003089 [Claviceps purpurea]KAG6285389.1 hypothetical protein E4U46_005903 [Claviceps purpurea]
MQAVILPTTYSDPSGFELSSLPRPKVTNSSDVVVRVHASSINPIDVKKASGLMKMMSKDSFPYGIGYDVSGVVTAVGSSVKRVRVGDEVYFKLPESHRGAWAHYAKCPERYVAHKPKSISFEEAAAIPLAALTALQGLRKYEGSLSGKTVFVPAGLSGTGSFACQLAKNVFGAGKVITTVSTSKVAKVPVLLGEGVVDQVIDYTTTDPMAAIPPKSVDFLFDTTGQSMQFLSRMVPETGLIISISTTPSGTQMQSASDFGNVPFVVSTVLDTIDSVRKWRAWRWSIRYEFLCLEPSGQDLDELRGYVENGKLKSVVGTTVPLEDIEQVRKAAMVTYQAKGGIGKTVFTMAADGK